MDPSMEILTIGRFVAYKAFSGVRQNEGSFFLQ